MTIFRPAPNDKDDEGLARAVRAAFDHPLPEIIAERHIAAMVAARMQAAVTPRVSPVLDPRRRVGLALAAALIGSATLATGLSYAGVITLPEPARSVLSKIGITLPDSGAPEDPGPPEGTPTPTTTPSGRPTATPTPTATPGERPTGAPSNLPDEADSRADDGADNADPRADSGADNANDPGHQADAGADNADARADDGGDNASENSEGDVAGP